MTIRERVSVIESDIKQLQKDEMPPVSEYDIIERHMTELRNEVLEEAYNIARGGDDRFERRGVKQAYWKGRSDAAAEIRKAQTTY